VGTPEGKRTAVKISSIRRRRALSIRTRVLTLALVPSIVFLIAGVLGAGYLIIDAAKTKNYFQLAATAQDQALPLIVSLQEERRLTLRRLASYGTFQSDLFKQRKTTDALKDTAVNALSELSGVAPDSVNKNIREFTTLMGDLPALRARVDGGQVGIAESFSLYNDIIDQFINGAKGLAQFAPDAETAYLQTIVAPLLESADLMQRSDALAAADLVGGGLTDSDFSVYQGQVGSYHLQLNQTVPLSTPEVQAQFRKLTGSPAWLRLMSVEEVLLRGDTNLPISEDLWRGAAADVSKTLTVMLQTQSQHTNDLALGRVNTTLTQSIIAGILVLVLVAAVFVFALRLSRRLIERLVRLRTETLDLAEHRLPALVERVRTGADVQVDEAVRLREYGGDEIGEVADAFNKAQQTAVAAAVQEAKTREGTNKVFLNIAHRSQVIVHRQLKTLDEAERKQEDPEQLELLFQLDHLTTRQRRNAENLIILGGGQPGRKWRNPVSLTEVVRGAAAETEDFARVKTAQLPQIAVRGQVVGDLVHLLAELIDNATSFSPPQSRVEIRGNVVGKGVVIEVEDQGLGLEPEQTDEINTMLTDPPDFGIMALSEEPRLGLFVVGRLAARHGIQVHLRESAYGGTRAIVLVRTDLLAPISELDETPKPKAEPAPEPVLEEPPGSDGVSQIGRQPRRTTRHRPEPRVPVSVAPTTTPATPQGPPSAPTAVQPALPTAPAPVASVPAAPETPARPPAPPTRAARPARPAAQPPAWPPQEPRPSVPEARPQQPRRPEAPGRPPLPQRRRQQNLVPQLMEDKPAPTQEREEVRLDSPEAARSRLSAFQAGTRRGRDTEPAENDDRYGERE